MEDFKLGMVIPGEQLVVAVLNYASVVRGTMSQENRDRFDLITIQSLEDWRKFWIKLGIIPQ